MKIPEVLRIEVVHRAGSLARVLGVVAEAGLLVEDLVAVERGPGCTIWELTTELDEGFDLARLEKINELPIARLLGTSDRVFALHEGGKIETRSRMPIATDQLLRDIYTPGVARVCLAIRDDPSLQRAYTRIGNSVAIVTDGTAVLGLGNIGPVAGMPVMEGKAALFHELAGISGTPILLQPGSPEELVETIVRISPTFGAIQLEDIGAPACFEIERALVERLDRPVLHDDQHGTAVVALAALLTATRRFGIDLSECTVGQVGLGAAGIGIARLLLHRGISHLIGSDLRPEAIELFSGFGGQPADLESVMAKSEIVIATTGVRGLIRPELVREGKLILALTNPDPEIEPAVALERGARYAADGKSVNNVLGFPGLFRGALDAQARAFSMEMLDAAANRLSELATGEHLVPSPLDRSVHSQVAEAVAEAARGEVQTPLYEGLSSERAEAAA
ncbi:MAG: NADP-dependent malic enzyme [Chloroflexi bacterium]|nr:NADP-dependent malic enzyme [Chloroflexota bacterium]MDA1145967.1 NADP-dependent malic enzyme [Chloroflexota bacterium]